MSRRASAPARAAWVAVVAASVVPIVGVTAVAVTAVAVTGCAQVRSAATVDDGAPAGPRDVEIRIFGMECPIRCPLEVRDQLRAVPGVLHVDVDSDTHTARVRIAAGTAPEALLAALEPPYSGRLR